MLNSSTQKEPEAVLEQCSVNNESAMPDVEDCSTGYVPHKGERELIVPDFNSMFKFMFNRELGNKRLEIYTFLNQLLRRGHLSEIVGFPVDDRIIDRHACEIKGVSFWKISRTEFYADVEVELTLRSYRDTVHWSGYVICWCEFSDQFYLSAEELTSLHHRHDADMIQLSPFLVPYYTNRKMDEIAEDIWRNYDLTEALTDPKARNAVRLAERMGLSILYLPVYEHKEVDSIVFFSGQYAACGCRPDRKG